MKLSAKQKMLNAQSKKDGVNTFTIAQARSRFGIQNVTARVSDLRKEGYNIKSVAKTLSDGRKATVYQLGA